MQYLRALGIRYENADSELSDNTDSDEEQEEEEMWNPLEIIDQFRKAESKEERLKLKRSLLEKFLDQKNPLVVSQMKDFLAEEGVTETFIGFLSRADENNGKPEPDTKIVQQRTIITPETEAAVKRSFKLMKIFLNPTTEFDRLVSQKLAVIAGELFRVFETNAAGNFYHFRGVYEQLLYSRPAEFIRLIMQNNYLFLMAEHIHEPAISDALLSYFGLEFRNILDAQKFYTDINNSGILGCLVEKVTAKGSPQATQAAEFVVRIIDKLNTVEAASEWFVTFASSSKLIDQLFTTLTTREAGYTSEQKKACASVIRELLLKSTAHPMLSEYQKPLPNILGNMSDKLHEYAHKFVVPLCEELIALDASTKIGNQKPVLFSAFTVPRPFGITRLILAEILSDMVVSDPTCLVDLPQQIWRVLAGWFLDYPHNNIYHCHFWKIIQIALVQHHVPSLKILLSKYKFLTNLIKLYQDPSRSAARGFTVQILNLVRLAADAESSDGYLKELLMSSDTWNSFIPTLRAETERQLRPGVEPVRRYRPVDDDISIDLGSPYARSLGITAVAPAPSPIKKSPAPKVEAASPASTPGSSTSTPGSSPSVQSPGGVDSPTTKRKKKKNKNKKKVAVEEEKDFLSDEERKKLHSYWASINPLDNNNN